MVLDNLLGLAAEAEGDAEAYEVAAREAVRALVAPKGKVEPRCLEREQFAAHGFAWIATYVAALRQMRRWAERLRRGKLGELELLMLQSAFGEYLAQLAGGIAMSQVEIVRPGRSRHRMPRGARHARRPQADRDGNTDAAAPAHRRADRRRLDFGNFGALDWATRPWKMVRDQFRRFAEDRGRAARP